MAHLARKCATAARAQRGTYNCEATNVSLLTYTLRELMDISRMAVSLRTSKPTTFSRTRLAWPCVAVLLWLCMATASAQDWNYRVRPGDTLWDLSGEYLKPGIAWQKLQRHNKIADPHALPPGSTLRVPLTWLRMQPASAKVMAVKGQASVESPSASTSSAASEGMALEIGTVLHTGPGASLSLEFADGSRLLLKENSELHLDRMSRYGKSGMVDTHLRLQRGRITNTVQPTRGNSPSFIVDTPNASSAVRGTHFRVDAGEAGTLAEVTEGKVVVATGKQQAMVGHGFGTSVPAGKSSPLKVVRLLPAPDLSTLAPKLNGTRAQLQWPAIEGADSYRIEVSDTPQFDGLLADIESSTAQTTLPVLQDGHYSVRIRGVDAKGLQGLDAVARLEVETLPEPPYAVAPAIDAVVREAQVGFRWSKVTDAGSYYFELADEPSFAKLLMSHTASDASPLRLPQALAPGSYYWRIASNRADGKRGPFSDPMPFTVQPLPEAGDIGNESDGKRMSFHWRAGEAGQKYRFQLSRSPTFEKLHVDQLVDQPQITLPRLRAGTWYLRAQGIGSDGHEGPVPPAQSVQVPCRLCGPLAASTVLLLMLAL